jgi:hypothetical protein
MRACIHCHNLKQMALYCPEKPKEEEDDNDEEKPKEEEDDNDEEKPKEEEHDNDEENLQQSSCSLLLVENNKQRNIKIILFSTHRVKSNQIKYFIGLRQ